MTTPLPATLRKLIEAEIAERLDENIEGLARVVSGSASGKASASIGIKAILSNGRLNVQVSMGYGEKFGTKGETSADIDDPKQPKLKGVE